MYPECMAKRRGKKGRAEDRSFSTLLVLLTDRDATRSKIIKKKSSRNGCMGDEDARMQNKKPVRTLSADATQHVAPYFLMM